ncbi:hypothetical protein Tco_0146245 [Tanacetum coccineum]
MRPFGCPITILNTIDHLGKFDGKEDEWFFVGYSTNSKSFRVFNSRTKIVKENMHVKFSEDTCNIAGSGPTWLFDIDALTKSMNYEPVVAGNQSNGSTGTKACDDAGKARMKTVPGKDYILLPLLTQDPSFSSSLKDSPDAGFRPSGEEEKKDAKDPENKDSEVPNTEEPRVNQEQDANVNNTNNIKTVSPTVNAADIENIAADDNIVYECDDDPNVPDMKDKRGFVIRKRLGVYHGTLKKWEFEYDVSAFYMEDEEESFCCQTSGFFERLQSFAEKFIKKDVSAEKIEFTSDYVSREKCVSVLGMDIRSYHGLWRLMLWGGQCDLNGVYYVDGLRQIILYILKGSRGTNIVHESIDERIVVFYDMLAVQSFP